LRDNALTRRATVVNRPASGNMGRMLHIFRGGGRNMPRACLRQAKRSRGDDERTTASSRHALIAAASGSTPMMFITRVML